MSGENQIPAEKILLSRAEAATALGVSLRTIDALLAAHQLVSRRIGRRRLIPRTELERFTRGDHPTKPKSSEAAEGKAE